MHRTVIACLLLATVAGCGHARLVNRTQYGGVYALEGDRNKAMEDAHRSMAQHCQGPYSIISEGEAVVGSETAQASESYVTEEGTVVNEGGTSTRDATEWRVQYQCGQTANVPSQPSPYASPSFEEPPQLPPPPPPPPRGY
jgi:hypothetical protein